MLSWFELDKIFICRKNKYYYFRMRKNFRRIFSLVLEKFLRRLQLGKKYKIIGVCLKFEMKIMKVHRRYVVKIVGKYFRFHLKIFFFWSALITFIWYRILIWIPVYNNTIVMKICCRVAIKSCLPCVSIVLITFSIRQRMANNFNVNSSEYSTQINFANALN